MKRSLCVFLLLALITVFSCAKSYRNDLAVSELTESVREELNHPIEYVRAKSDYLDQYFKMPDSIREFDLYYAADGNNLNEFGIFRVSEEDADDLFAKIEAYLSRNLEENQAFYDSYIPQETPKLRDAEVRRFGSYVAYAILDSQGRQSLFAAIEKKLCEK